MFAKRISRHFLAVAMLILTWTSLSASGQIWFTDPTDGQKIIGSLSSGAHVYCHWNWTGSGAGWCCASVKVYIDGVEFSYPGPDYGYVDVGSGYHSLRADLHETWYNNQEFITGTTTIHFYCLNRISMTYTSWNMVGIPNQALDFHKSVIYPGISVDNIEAYNGAGYQSAPDPLNNNTGYFVKFGTNQSINYDGYVVNSKAMTVGTGWNIIGSITQPVATSSVTPSSGVTIQSSFYTYQGSYVTVTTLTPGLGFWVKVSAPGTLTLTASSMSPKAEIRSDFLATLDRFSLKDDLGIGQDLYVNSSNDPSLLKEAVASDLPPEPPGSLFNARFASGKYIESIDKQIQQQILPISFSSVKSSITMQYDIQKGSNRTYSLLEDGSRIPLTGSGKAEIRSDVRSLALEAVLIDRMVPSAFSLEQNFPNPFNPSTKIEYALAKDAQVTLKVYNTLGQLVATVLDEFQTAGYKTATIDAANLPSGVYIYRLQAGTFTETKKMILAK